MSSTYAEPLDRLETCLDEIGSVNPTYRTVTEKQEAMRALAKAKARIDAELMRILAVAGDVAETTATRSPAAWLASVTRDAPGRLRADATLATALDTRWSDLQAAFRKGEVNLAQVRVIDKALTDLPHELGEDLLAKAETLLVQEAARLGPRDLAILGSRLMEYLAPESADQHEHHRLLTQEHRASAATRLSLRRRGDGSTDLHARIPDLAAAMLTTYLAAFTNPRRRHQPDQQQRPESSGAGEFANLPRERQSGIAFVALLERVLTTDLPRHGGRATSLVVTIGHHQLLADLDKAGLAGTAQTTGGQKLTAGQARRLACNTGILPIVLGGKSVVLDQGRKKRLFDDNQRIALQVRDKACTELDCTVPATYCEAHHQTPWSQDGPTNLHDGRLLCPYHHDRAHDPTWTVTYHPNGTTTFHRRQ
ncbi:DUF222 domain-containing protein [Nocardioides agariphilus]|uniref:DUF222 domain-containing protein n=1 Tax=Nocardioides agariphilus TaxID=433664 RepID=A0A930YIB2_9ACTN|nr:HNH endonuclease signature motif containing protein [Nocardioides agariphilus]MBF4769526.1 DUF222 domain-containing protein [Nocardioides agariphilus]